MPALIVYLLKVNAALILFFVAYRFGLRRLTFYYLNRFFLVFGIVFSSIYPFVDLSQLFTRHEVLSRQLNVIVPDWHAVVPVITQKAAEFDYWRIPIVLFWMGVVFMATRLIIQFISLYKIYRSSQPGAYNGQQFRSVRDDVNPFSFWQAIYLNPDNHSDEELRSIIKHEQIHVRQWHTLDVLLAELSTVFYWFNPGVWLMKQAVKENLEFITDRQLLQSGIDEKAYQYSLVRVSSLRPGAAIVNKFNFLTIKKRIIMMNKERSSKAQVTRYVVLLPLVMLLALIFTVSKAELGNKTFNAFVKKVLPKAITVQTDTPATKLHGKEKHLTLKVDTVTTLTKSNSFSTGSADTANNLSFYVTSSAPAFSTASSVPADSTVVDKKNHKIILYKTMTYTNADNKAQNMVYVDTKANLDYNKAVVIVNGTVEPADRLNGISPSQIDSISILNKSQAIALYGDEGKNGMVLVHVKNGMSKDDLYASGQTMAVASAIKVRPYAVVNSDIDEITYIFNPNRIDTKEFDGMKKLFKNYGFTLDYTGDIRNSLSVSVKSKTSQASASYSTDDVKGLSYSIRITANKKTGSVSIGAENDVR